MGLHLRKKITDLMKFKKNYCCYTHWLSVIISVATGSKNVFNIFSHSAYMNVSYD